MLLVYNGKSSTDLDILIEHYPDYNIPERDVESIHIPGRNGDIIIDHNESYKNVSRSYDIAVISDSYFSRSFSMMANEITQWLTSATGYARLEDDYDPDHYVMARLNMSSSAIKNILAVAGRVTIKFDCKPQRYLKIGDEPITIDSSPKSVHNPTDKKSLPIITVEGSGAATLNVNGYSIVISSISGSITINSDVQGAYSGAGVNRNSDVSLPDGFPKLSPGQNVIQYSGSGITKVEVIPKWWTL